MTQTVLLKKGLPIENGGHILYVFKDRFSYIENLVAFIVDGFTLGHRVLIIDRTEVYQEVTKILKRDFPEMSVRDVFFEDNGVFYAVHDDFKSGVIAEHFGELLQSLPNLEQDIRTWARAAWRDQDDINSKLENNENIADAFVQSQGIISVCAYDGMQIPGELMTKMLKHHDYFMTDTELVRSPLYTEPKEKVIFPSLSVQTKIESEIDFYKNKLDFVHVVSHEVRNPLTIVKAYANLLQTTEPNLKQESLEKLRSIDQYVKVIDQELTNIIETERMLSNELYMKLEPITPFETLQIVTELMAIKASVQNVSYVSDIKVSQEEMLMGNKMGLKLIVSNLISNAIKYTSEQGKVTFSAYVVDGQIKFVIRDNGIGMSNKELNSLYKKYGKINETKSGQGIGLYMVKNITDRFNGSIHFDSELGYGTEVTVTIPLING